MIKIACTVGSVAAIIMGATTIAPLLAGTGSLATVLSSPLVSGTTSMLGIDIPDAAIKAVSGIKMSDIEKILSATDLKSAADAMDAETLNRVAVGARAMARSKNKH